jgi:hypothetical protein
MTAAAIANDSYGRRPRPRLVATLLTLLEAFVVLDPNTHACTLFETRSWSRWDRRPFLGPTFRRSQSNKRKFEE